MDLDLYLIESPQAAPERLATSSALEYDPAFSPDGRWLVFTSERRGNPDLWALDLSSDAPPVLLTPSETMQDAAAFSPDGRSLAFVDTRDGNAEIYLMPFRLDNPAGAFGQAVNLTRNPGGDFRPAYSPDGRNIAFSSDRDRAFSEPQGLDSLLFDRFMEEQSRAPSPVLVGPAGARVGADIYLMEADGSNPRRLTEANGWDGSPTWSRDGRTLYFYSERGGSPRIWRMSPDGGGQARVSAAEVPAVSPAVLREGRVAYAALPNYPGSWRILSVTADGQDGREEAPPEQDCRGPAVHPQTGHLVCYGTPPDGQSRAPYFAKSLHRAVGQRGVVRLPDRTIEIQGLHRHFPAFSPDGRDVASTKALSANEADGGTLVVAPVQGEGEREIFRPIEPEFPFGLSWSGEWVAFSVGPPFAPEAAAVDVWKVRSDGSGAVNLTKGSAANDAWPDASSDGQRIVFRSGRDGNFEIYLMDADGKNVRRLTDHPARDTMPAFSPRGDRVAFTSNRHSDYEIYLLDLTEEGGPGALRRLTHSPGRDMHVRFSPDAQWVAFTSSRGGFNDELLLDWRPQPYGEIYAMRIEDGLVVRLTHNKWEDGPVAWGPSPGPATRR